MIKYVKVWVQALRLHQWCKNLLVFVPLLLSGHLGDYVGWLLAAQAFVALGLLASATYLINDWKDAPEDRLHWKKKDRPQANGTLTPGVVLPVAAVLAVAALVLGAMLGAGVLVLLVGYAVATLSYSFGGKKVALLDVTILAGLYTLRLGLGAVAVGVPLSGWLAVFSMFVFLSLSLAKRQTELLRAKAKGREGMVRGYAQADSPLVLGLGLASLFAAVLVMVLYLTQEAMPAGVYARPAFLWCWPLILWLGLARLWLLTQRGELDDDPVVYALKDKPSLLLAGLLLVSALLAL